MATYVNNLRLKEITTGDEDGTWGTSTNTNLELITDGFSYGTKEMAADANETFTMPDATADDTRSFYLKITSAASLTATREVTLGPNTVSKVWVIENATSGGQTITVKQGTGATIDIANGNKAMVVTDGAGATGAVFDASPSSASGVVTLDGVQTLTNKTLTSPVLGGTTTTASGDLEFDPATQTVVIKGGGSDEGAIKLNCSVNTHGQTIKAQPHAEAVTNEMLLPKGASSTLVSLVSTDTLTNKTLRDTIYALSGTAFDATNGAIQTKTLSADTTFTDSLVSGDSIVLMLNAGASYTVTWPTVTWVSSAGDAAPTLTANDTLVFWKISTTLYGSYVGSYT